VFSRATFPSSQQLSGLHFIHLYIINNFHSELFTTEIPVRQGISLLHNIENLCFSSLIFCAINEQDNFFFELHSKMSANGENQGSPVRRGEAPPKTFVTDAPRLMAPHTRSWTIDRIRRATFYRDTHALVAKRILTRLHLLVPLHTGRRERPSKSRRKHGLNKNTVAYCANQTGVRAELAEFFVR
jgi:hypothetical protein